MCLKFIKGVSTRNIFRHCNLNIDVFLRKVIALLCMIGKWKNSLNEEDAFGALLTEFFKAFDCLPHELPIAEIHAYWVDILSSKLLYSYLTKQKQRMKLSGTRSSWSEIIFGVPQGFTLRTLLFNTFLFDLFQFFPDLDITNYTDDNTPHSTNKKLNKVLRDPEKAPNTLFKWVTENLLETNPDKSHLLAKSTQQ